MNPHNYSNEFMMKTDNFFASDLTPPANIRKMSGQVKQKKYNHNY